eukprot:2058840-Amphidinium_carterae.2
MAVSCRSSRTNPCSDETNKIGNANFRSLGSSRFRIQDQICCQRESLARSGLLSGVCCKRQTLTDKIVVLLNCDTHVVVTPKELILDLASLLTEQQTTRMRQLISRCEADTGHTVTKRLSTAELAYT